MATILSVDLAYKCYEDIGIVLLSNNIDATHIKLIKPHSLGLQGTPNPTELAQALIQLCYRNKSNIIILDGPQAWKDPENGHIHARVCERKLNTPAKTGLPGHVIPRNYKPFVEFSIRIFNILQQLGDKLLLNPEDRPLKNLLALESFPLSAWKGLQIDPLPSKRKAKTIDILDRAEKIKGIYDLRLNEEPSHDELQAIVSGLGGVAFQKEKHGEYEIVGERPRLVEGILREGFIVNPKRSF